jgi:hypothetical protein
MNNTVDIILIDIFREVLYKHVNITNHLFNTIQFYYNWIKNSFVINLYILRFYNDINFYSIVIKLNSVEKVMLTSLLST